MPVSILELHRVDWPWHACRGRTRALKRGTLFYCHWLATPQPTPTFIVRSQKVGFFRVLGPIDLEEPPPPPPPRSSPCLGMDSYGPYNWCSICSVYILVRIMLPLHGSLQQFACMNKHVPNVCRSIYEVRSRVEPYLALFIH